MKQWGLVVWGTLLMACSPQNNGMPSPPSKGSEGYLEGECERTVVYRHRGEHAPIQVRIAGDFEEVSWTGSARLSDDDGDGVWTGVLPLKEGTYSYRYIVDDEWVLDLDNPNKKRNSLGDFNSVMAHRCPWEPMCISDTACEPVHPYCRYYCCFDDPSSQPAESAGGEACDSQQGTELGCVFDTDCSNALEDHCNRGVCEPNPCSLKVFIFDPGEATYDSVHVAGSFNDWPPSLAAGGLAMAFEPSSRVWYAKENLADGAYSYKFVINDGEQWILDPENQNQLGDGLGGYNSLFSQECEARRCEGDFEWRDAVMYFAMVDRFYNSDTVADTVLNASEGNAGRGPSGQYTGGDLAGITEKLPYLRDLGVNALWISAPFENRNEAGAAINPEQDVHLYSAYHGYWPSPDNIDYGDPSNPIPTPLVESRIGTESDLRELVESAHATDTPGGGRINVLFDYVMNHVDDNSGLYQAHPEWFIEDQGAIPLCGPGDLWEDPYWGTRCAFTDYLPAFDFYNPEARTWSINDALWWAKEFNIDGYRLDAIKHVPLSWLTELRGALTEAFPYPEGGRFYLVGETFSYDDRELLKSFVEPNSMLDGQFDFPMKARLCEAFFSFQMGLSGLANWMDDNDRYYGRDAIMTTWIGNHDVPRAIHFASGEIGNCREGSHTGNSWTSAYSQPTGAAAYERLGLAFAVMMTNPGIPLIYYGDEVGLAGGGDPDNRRLMPWEASELNAYQISLREKVAKLGVLRQTHRSLSRGTRITLHADDDTWVYKITGCGASVEDLVVGINRSDVTKTVWIPEGTYNNLITGGSMVGGNLELGPRTFVLLQ